MVTVAELSMLDHFKQSIHLCDSIFKSLADMAKHMDKKKFRPFLDEPCLIDNAFRNAKHES